MNRINQLTKEEIEPVVAARSKVTELANTADKAIKDAKLAELEFRVQIQQLYLMKGLDPNCRVDITTGAVTWPDEAAVATTVAEPPKKRGRKAATKVETVETPVDPAASEGE